MGASNYLSLGALFGQALLDPDARVFGL